MPPLEPYAEKPEDWIVHAKSDLLVAQMAWQEGVLYETLCWHALQAAEKALKAVLIHFGIEYPRTHAIEKLIRLIPSQIQVPDEVKRAARLSGFLVQRYPGDHEEVSEDDYREAVKSAEAVLKWAEEIVGAGRS